MSSKRCICCGEIKAIDQFYAHEMMRDGRLNKCSACVRAYQRERRYGPARERIHAYDKLRSASSERRQLNRTVTARYRAQHPRRRAAQIALCNAVRDKRVVRWPVCALPECDCTTVEAHHPDYDAPLDVVWLCPSHHKAAHALARRPSTRSIA